MSTLGYLAKLKKGLGLPFSGHFLHDFYIKMVLVWFSINGQTFNVTSYFLSQDIKQNVLSSYLDSWWRHKF